MKRARGRAPTPRSRRESERPHGGETPWDRAAAWYDSLVGAKGSEFHESIVLPGTMRLLEVKAGERVLDLGCGQGVVSRAMHKAGATVTGVDMSRRLIELARRRSSRDIQYLVADARDLKALERGSFDAIAWVLAAQDTEPIEPVFINCARLLRPGGRLVMVINHPAFRIPRQSRWGFDEERKLLYRAVDRYLTPLSIPIDIHPFRAPARQQTWTYHRPLEAYIKGLAGEGLWVNALEEWPSHRVSQPGPLAAAENRSREEFPLFLALRAVRVPQERSV